MYNRSHNSDSNRYRKGYNDDRYERREEYGSKPYGSRYDRTNPYRSSNNSDARPYRSSSYRDSKPYYGRKPCHTKYGTRNVTYYRKPEGSEATERPSRLQRFLNIPRNQRESTYPRGISPYRQSSHKRKYEEEIEKDCKRRRFSSPERKSRRERSFLSNSSYLRERSSSESSGSSRSSHSSRSSSSSSSHSKHSSDSRSSRSIPRCRHSRKERTSRESSKSSSRSRSTSSDCRPRKYRQSFAPHSSDSSNSRDSSVSSRSTVPTVSRDLSENTEQDLTQLESPPTSEKSNEESEDEIIDVVNFSEGEDEIAVPLEFTRLDNCQQLTGDDNVIFEESEKRSANARDEMTEETETNSSVFTSPTHSDLLEENSHAPIPTLSIGLHPAVNRPKFIIDLCSGEAVIEGQGGNCDGFTALKDISLSLRCGNLFKISFSENGELPSVQHYEKSNGTNNDLENAVIDGINHDIYRSLLFKQWEKQRSASTQDNSDEGREMQQERGLDKSTDEDLKITYEQWLKEKEMKKSFVEDAIEDNEKDEK